MQGSRLMRNDEVAEAVLRRRPPAICAKEQTTVEREMEVARAVAALNRPLGKEVIAPADYPRWLDPIPE